MVISINNKQRRTTKKNVDGKLDERKKRSWLHQIEDIGRSKEKSLRYMKIIAENMVTW